MKLADFHVRAVEVHDKVYLGFPEANHLQSPEEYCFVATASNGTLTVLVEGFMLTTGTSLCHVHVMSP